MFTRRVSGMLFVTSVMCGFACPASAQNRPAVAAQPARPATAYRKEERAFPTGDRASSIVVVERTLPVEVRRGEMFTYELKLTNLTRARIDELLLTEQFPPSFKVAQIIPEAGRNADSAAWSIKVLGPGASENFQITGSTDRPEELSWCATVAFKTMVCSSTKVVEPRLALQKTMPAAVLLCDDIPIRINVSNPGSGAARNVTVSDTLPAGLTTKDGKSGFAIDVGDLAAGQAREFTITAKATRPGTYENTASARDSTGLKADASARVVVSQPTLVVTKRGPTLRYLGRPCAFEITVQNTGDAPARDTVLVDMLPAGFELISADGDGRLADGRITWNLGTMAPQAARTVKLNIKPTQIGRMTNTATARAYCAEGSASAVMDVQGISAILLEVVDLADPIEVGAQETYEIIVTNQGSAPDTNILIECTLPPEEEFVSSTGPTATTATGNVIRFAPVPVLPAKAKATFKIVAKGLKEGDVRFKATLKSDQTTTIVEETESTHIY